MRVRKIRSGKPVVLLLFILPCQCALADNSTQTPPGVNQSNQVHQVPHVNLYNLSLPRLEEKPSPPPQPGSGNVVQTKSSEQGGLNNGLHWTTVDSHPGVGYQLDKNEDVRLHFGGHGAVASFALHF